MDAKGKLLGMFNNKHNDRKTLVLKSISQSVQKETMVGLIMKKGELMEKIINGFKKDELVDLVLKYSDSNKKFINFITNNTTARIVIEKVEKKEQNNRNIRIENENRRRMATGGGPNGWTDFDGYR